MKYLLTGLLLTLSLSAQAGDSFTGNQFNKQVGFQNVLYCQYRAAFGGTYWKGFTHTFTCPMYSGGL